MRANDARAGGADARAGRDGATTEADIVFPMQTFCVSAAILHPRFVAVSREPRKFVRAQEGVAAMEAQVGVTKRDAAFRQSG
jgi:hypothetical protein